MAIIGAREKRFLRTRIAALLSDPEVARDVRTKLAADGVIAADQGNDIHHHDLSHVLLDFLDRNDGCALAFLVGHEVGRGEKAADRG